MQNQVNLNLYNNNSQQVPVKKVVIEINISKY